MVLNNFNESDTIILEAYGKTISISFNEDLLSSLTPASRNGFSIVSHTEIRTFGVARTHVEKCWARRMAMSRVDFPLTDHCGSVEQNQAPAASESQRPSEGLQAIHWDEVCDGDGLPVLMGFLSDFAVPDLVDLLCNKPRGCQQVAMWHHYLL